MTALPLIIAAALILITVSVRAAGGSLAADIGALLTLKSFLEDGNPVNRGVYAEWGGEKGSNSNPCSWPGVLCSRDSSRVTGIDLSGNLISSPLFNNFSALTELSYLDLSGNTIGGLLPADLSSCMNLKHLNLSHNLIEGSFALTGLPSLEVLDVSTNRLSGEIASHFPQICGRLVVANLSLNRLTGRIDSCFDSCPSLQHLDLSANNFSGENWLGFARLKQYTVSENGLSGGIPSSIFASGCSLLELDLSANRFAGEFPDTVSNCVNLEMLNLWGNGFTGKIPWQIGWISTLRYLILGSNRFSGDVPDSLVNCSRLAFLDLSNNKFGGEIQSTFAKFTSLKFLVLHGNSYTGGIVESGILQLPDLVRLDLSFNNFSGQLPLELAGTRSLEFLMLSNNQFTGSIPAEYGSLVNLQALDLSFNRLTGSIPSSIGNLDSLLWLMLAGNALDGEIPAEIGNCRSLLWLNLADNRLSGKVPPELANIGANSTPTFELNRRRERVNPGSGECSAMRRWIPAKYPPFSHVYTLLTMKNCRTLWEQLLRGYGIFPVCTPGSPVRKFEISGYLQVSGNELSGELPREMGKMMAFSMLHMGENKFHGSLPPEISRIPLIVLNVSDNGFSGEIPDEIGSLKCLQNLDLSCNNFSGAFPASLNDLSELNKFNVSYNPLISGVIPKTGQLATFDKDSYLGDPLLQLPDFISNKSSMATKSTAGSKSGKLAALFVVLALLLSTFICGVLVFIVCHLIRSPADSPGYLLQEAKDRKEAESSSGSSSPWLTTDSVKVVIRLDKTAFTYEDILKATAGFSDDRVIGKGGSGIVYRGALPDGREVAVKRLQREGLDGEREFLAEMEVLSGNGFGWPHPNLVALHGWCFDGAHKILVYEYMEGGSLEDLISDRVKLTWRRRLEVAIGVSRALVFLHHECFPPVVHRDVKASNVLLDKDGKARVTDFGLARVMDVGDSHVSTTIAGTVGYVAPEYGQTWQATTKGDVYSFGILAMELATGRRAVDGGEECLVDWARRITRGGPVPLMGSGLVDGAEEMCELLRLGMKCAADAPHARPSMIQVLSLLLGISSRLKQASFNPR
uniref:non-specific serine/threonine protein kinase n=1 Tax=Kalanchoe fedtschenkoi TaxID=63787 RepID=A0A7N0ZY03_KALFE